MEGFVDRSSAVSCFLLWFTGGDCDTVIYSTDLFKGVSVSDALFWLTSFLSSILVMCLVGRGLELGLPVVSTGLVLRSLSANHMPSIVEVLLVGELHDYRIVSHDIWTTLITERCLLRRRLFVTGSDCFGNSFCLDFQFLVGRQYYVSMYWNVYLLEVKVLEYSFM